MVFTRDLRQVVIASALPARRSFLVLCGFIGGGSEDGSRHSPDVFYRDESGSAATYFFWRFVILSGAKRSEESPVSVSLHAWLLSLGFWLFFGLL